MNEVIWRRCRTHEGQEREVSYKDRDGVEHNAVEQKFDTLMRGVVESTTKGTTRNGKEFFQLKLRKEPAAEAFDPASGEVVKYPEVPERTIRFFNEMGRIRTDAAAKAERMKLRPGSRVEVKASENVQTEEDGTVRSSYFGTKCYYENGSPIEFRSNEYGEGAFIVVGPACLNDQNDVLSIPMNLYDRENGRYTVWGRFQEDPEIGLSPETVLALSPDDDGKRKHVALVFSPSDFHEDGEGKEKEVTGFFSSVQVVPWEPSREGGEQQAQQQPQQAAQQQPAEAGYQPAPLAQGYQAPFAPALNEDWDDAEDDGIPFM